MNLPAGGKKNRKRKPGWLHFKSLVRQQLADEEPGPSQKIRKRDVDGDSDFDYLDDEPEVQVLKTPNSRNKPDRKPDFIRGNAKRSKKEKQNQPKPIRDVPDFHRTVSEFANLPFHINQTFDAHCFNPNVTVNGDFALLLGHRWPAVMNFGRFARFSAFHSTGLSMTFDTVRLKDSNNVKVVVIFTHLRYKQATNDPSNAFSVVKDVSQFWEAVKSKCPNARVHVIQSDFLANAKPHSHTSQLNEILLKRANACNYVTVSPRCLQYDERGRPKHDSIKLMVESTLYGLGNVA